MKRTLVICGQYPLPENNGANIRTMNFVRFFQNYGTVDIAYFKKLKEEKLFNSPFLNEHVLKIEDNAQSKSYKDKLKRLLDLKNRPLPVIKYNDDSERLLMSVLESNNYDYILVRYIVNTNIVCNLTNKYRMRTIIDFDDILSGPLYDAKLDLVKGIHRKVIFALNRRFLVDYEKNCLSFGASLFCSSEDKAKFINNGQRDNAFVVPNIYANKSFEGYDFGDGFMNENILLFVGTLNYRPNVCGLRWFVESCFPHFKKRYPDARLLVVGRSPDAEISKICDDNEEIELYPDVPDIKDYYKKCKAVIVPLLAGGGTRIKILEAALANRPVLSTPLGAEGLDLCEDDDYLSFKNAHEILAQYGRLLERDRYHSLIRHARHIVLTRYSAHEFNNAMENMINSLESEKHALAVGRSTGNLHGCITE